MNPKSETPTRVVCVGHAPYFGLHMPISSDDMQVEVLDFYHGDASNVFNAIEQFKPKLLFSFRPELIPPSILMSFGGLKIGFSSEIFPKIINGRTVGDKSHFDKLNFFMGTSTRNFDYIFHYDIASKSYLESRGVYMSDYPAYPLSDRLFTSEGSERDIDILFIGRVSVRRAALLERIKKTRARTVVIDHGLYGDDILKLLKRSKVVLNLHAEDHVSFEPRVLIGAAAGSQIVTEQIHTPTWLREDPFLRIDVKADEWVDLTMQAVQSFGEQSNVEARDKFRLALRDMCSANSFLGNALARISAGDMQRFCVRLPQE